MASEMMEALELLCQEKHIDQLYLLDRLEQSLAKSYADVLHLPFGARVTIDRASGRVYVYELVPKGEEDPEPPASPRSTPRPRSAPSCATPLASRSTRSSPSASVTS